MAESLYLLKSTLDFFDAINSYKQEFNDYHKMIHKKEKDMQITFELLQPKTKKWLSTANSIENVSWRAGKHLAEKMKSNQFTDWELVIIGETSEGNLACFCTVSKEDGLLDNKATPFIAYVFVSEKNRGHRVSEKLLECAETYLKKQHFESVYIVSGEVGLYEKYGYEKLENCETVHGDIESLFNKKLI